MKNYNDILTFMDSFSTESQCLEHLTELKWGAGYSCRKCTHTVCVKGRTWHHKRCQKCGYDESCTAHTLFHKLKFPIVKSFMICHQLSTMKKGMSSSEISRQYSIHQETAWCFKRKVQLAMRSCGQVLLKSKVEVDETVIGGYEHGAVGRSKGKKTPVQLVVEVEHDEAHPRRMKIKNARAMVIEGYSSDELSVAIEAMIDKDATIITDKWKAYSKAVGERKHIALLSDKGMSMPEIHLVIFNLKNWIRGTHHKVSKSHLQDYLNEYFYRFNNRNLLNRISIRILKLMTKHPEIPYK